MGQRSGPARTRKRPKRPRPPRFGTRARHFHFYGFGSDAKLPLSAVRWRQKHHQYRTGEMNRGLKGKTKSQKSKGKSQKSKVMRYTSPDGSVSFSAFGATRRGPPGGFAPVFGARRGIRRV